jgi:proline iminopeptidase
MPLRLLCAMVAATFVTAATFAQAPHRSGRVTGAGGVSLYYEVHGAASDTVVFLHGTPSTMYSLARDFTELARDFQLVFFDQRGGGRSQLVLNPDQLRWQDHVADIEALRAGLGLGRVHLLGVSWGSALAVLYAKEHPEHVNRVAVFPMRVRQNPDIPAVPGPLAPNLDRAQEQRARELRNAWATASDLATVCTEYWRLQERSMFARPERAAVMRGSFCDEPADVLRHTWEVSDARMRSLGDFDLRPTLHLIQAPTLIVKGTLTTMYHAWTEEWARALRNGRMLWIDDAGLLPWIEQPKKIFPALREFLKGGWPTDAKAIR